ncbi:ATPase, T2SS/T4P/T4SS family, partial [Escherichia coli]|uniref:ATPase, T2SS/T4P/T4SS family n=1 Tax=Escherichia coli TaxID=562 RepID=UPI0013A58609
MYDIEHLSSEIINEAIGMKVTDLHFIPQEDHCLITYRLHGHIKQWKTIKPRLADRLISHFKYRSDMDIGERRKPKSSSMVHKVQDSAYALRLSTLPTNNNESLAIRILPCFSTQTLSSLAVLQDHTKILYEITALSQG